MTIGAILLIIITVLVMLGVLQRTLDRLRLTDRQALFFVALMFVGGLVPDIPLGAVKINIGGCLVPLGLSVYLFIRAGSTKERVRSIIATILTAGAIYAMGHFLPDEPDKMWFDVNYAYGLAAGIIAWVLGRSRRCAFIAGITGMLLADTVQTIVVWSGGVQQTLWLGGAGVMDAVVISGVVAVLLAELVGEFAERILHGAKATESGTFERSERRR